MPRTSPKKKIERAAREAVLDTIPSLKALVEGGDKQAVAAFTALAKTGGLQGQNGIKITNQIGVDARNHGDTKADWAFFQKFRNRLEAGVMRRALPGPDDEPEPDPTPEPTPDAPQPSE